MKLGSRLLHKGLIVIAVPLAFGIVFSILLILLLNDLESKIQHELLLKEAIATVSRINRAGLVARCYADSYFAFNDSYYRDSYDESFNQAARQYQHLVKLLKTEHGFEENLKSMHRALVQLNKQSRLLMNMRVALPVIQNSMSMYGGQISPMVKVLINQSIHQSISLEQKLRKSAAAEASATVGSIVRIQIALACGVAISLLLTLFMAVYFSRNITNRLLMVLDNTTKLVNRKPLNLPAGGSDEIAELDQFLYISANKIRELERFKKELVGVVSHELKSPLASVSTFLVSLYSGVFGDISEKARSKAERADKNISRLMGLVRDLINLDRLEVGKLEMFFKEVNAADIVSGSVDSVKELAEKLGVTIEAKNTVGVVCADKDRLVQVLINLLSNALKFSPAGGIVSVATFESDGWFELRVSDQGRGIPESLRESIFQPFQQVEATDATVKKGTGLGLTICRNIIEQHGGKIGVDSVEGEGCTFWFKIPCAASGKTGTNWFNIPEYSLPHDKERPARAFYQASRISSGKSQRRGLLILHKGLILISVPLLFELVFVGLLTLLINQNLEQIRLEELSKNIVVTANRMICEIAQTASEGILYPFTHDRELLEQWKQGKDDVYGYRDQLTSLTVGTPRQKDNIESINKELAAADQLTTRLLNPGGKDLASLWNSPGLSQQVKHFLANGQSSVENLLAVEKRNGERLSKQRAGATKIIATALLSGIIMNILLSIGLAFYLMRSITSRLRHVMANMEHLARQEPLSQPIAGADEIAYLDEVFYHTANHLSELDKFKRELVSMVSHELRTPLMSIAASLSILASGALGALSDKARQRLGIAEEETERLVRLISDLLDIEKMQAGKFVLALAPVTLIEVVQSAITSVAAQAESRKVKIATAITDGAIRVDRDRIVQVIVNLLSNAVKFSNRGGTVKIESVLSATHLELRVTDEGRGIPETMQERIFERFVQVEEKDASEKGGSGLGLSIARSIVEQHGGMIGVESEEGSGSTFWFKLPISGPRETKTKLEVK